MQTMAYWFSNVSGGVCLAAMTVTLAILLVRYFVEPSHPGFRINRAWRSSPIVTAIEEPDSPNALQLTRQLKRRFHRKEFSLRKQMRVIANVLLFLVLSRLAIYLTGMIGAWWKGELDAFLHDFSHYWVRWDANHYLGLAENWYVNEGDPRYHIVFFPLYPLLVRLMRPVFFGNTAAAAVVLSNLCLLGAGWLLHRLVFEDSGERAANRAVRYLMFCPLSVFFSVPYPESLFLMLTLLAVLLARRRSFSLAIAAGALAANTRILGVVVAVPIFWEMLKHAHSLELWPEHKKKYVTRVALSVASVSLVLVGLGSYLLLNWQVTGNPFTFLTYQAEHWGQRFGWIWDSLRYSVEYAFTYDSPFWQYGVWVPQSILTAATLALLVATAIRVHPGDGAYAWVYLFIALAPTWLLSGPRYIAAMYALYPMLALVTRKKWQDAAMTAILFALMIVGAYLYAVIGNLL